MAGLKSCYKDSKNYSDKIMGDVTALLDNEGIEYTIKSNGTEVIMTANGQSEDSVLSLLIDNLDIPKDVISLLLDIVEISGTIYIRQNTK